MKKKPAKTPFPTPKHLKAATKRWFEDVVAEFELEEHHLRILALAAEAWDRCQESRAAIEKHGLTYNDRFGAPHIRPEVGVERDSRISFTRCVRELGLDLATPDAPRPPKGRC